MRWILLLLILSSCQSVPVKPDQKPVLSVQQRCDLEYARHGGAI